MRGPAAVARTGCCGIPFHLLRPYPAESGQAAFGSLTEQKQTFAVRLPNRRGRSEADIDRRHLAEA